MWDDVVDYIWVFGFCRVGSNVLLNRIFGYKWFLMWYILGLLGMFVMVMKNYCLCLYCILSFFYLVGVIIVL